MNGSNYLDHIMVQKKSSCKNAGNKLMVIAKKQSYNLKFSKKLKMS